MKEFFNMFVSAVVFGLFLCVVMFIMMAAVGAAEHAQGIDKNGIKDGKLIVRTVKS